MQPGEAPLLEVYADASFAPEGRESHGAFVVEFLGWPNLLEVREAKLHNSVDSGGRNHGGH